MLDHKDLLIYSNSCSFGASGQGHLVYSDHVASKCKGALVNRGIPGSCNRRIVRSALRDLNELKTDNKNILVLLGLTFVSRTELWQTDLPAYDNDGHFNSITVDHSKLSWREKGLIDTIFTNISDYARDSVREYYKNWLVHYQPEAEVTNLLTDLLMFTGWCRDQNIKYLIFSNVNVLPGDDCVGYNSPFISSLYDTINQDKHILNLWQFSFKDFALAHGLQPKDCHLYADHGHPGEEAHALFGNFLYNKIDIHDKN